MPDVRSAGPADVLHLRREVLRPGLPPAASVYPEDTLPTTVHLAAYGGDGEVVGVVTLFPEPWDGEPAWRLRGMATAPAVRGTGVGGALLRAGIRAVSAARAGLLWCNARTSASGFYARFRFRRVGEEFHLHPIGPHYRMLLALPDDGPGGAAFPRWRAGDPRGSPAAGG